MKLLTLGILILCALSASAQGNKTLRKNFENPPLVYRMNVNTHGMPANEHLQDSILDSYLACGYGGMATNVNWTDDYMFDDDQLAIMYRFVRAAKSRGMDVWLYDEKMYPSGMAGTIILDEHPDWEAEGLFFRDSLVTGPVTVSLPLLPGKMIKAAAVPEADGTLQIARARDLLAEIKDGRLEWNVPEGRWHIALISRNVLYDGFQAGTERGGTAPRYTSLLMPEVTERFIDVTHKRYAAALGAKLGTLFTATFTDEPSSMAQPFLNQGFGVYPWKQNVSDEFRKRTGSPLEDNLLAIMLDEGPEGQRMRYVYFQIISDFMSGNFFRPIKEYCRSQGLLSGGHLLVEETMMTHVPLYGSIMACYRELDAPGIDVLTGMPSFTRRYLYSSRLASSSAELEGNTYVMTEVCPISDYNFYDGKEAPTNQIKGSINRQIVGGVNKFNNYLQLQHEDAAGKDRFNTYIGRVASQVTGGVRASRIAVYYPIETMWTKFRPLPNGLKSWDDVEGGDPAAQKLDKLFDTVSDCLMENQWEFSYLDGRGLEESVVKNKKLTHGALQWDVLILPGAETLSEEAAARIAQFVAAGGKLIVLEALPVNSPAQFPSPQVQSTFTGIYAPERVNRTVFYQKDFDANELNRILDSVLERDVRFSLTGDILCMHRRIDDREVYFVANDCDRNRTFTVTFPRHRSLECLNPQTGRTYRIEPSSTFTLAPYESLIIQARSGKPAK